MLLILVLGLVSFGVCLILQAKILRRKTGVSYGEVVSEDSGADFKKIVQPIRSERYRLSGKPDYLLERNGYTIPKELKSGRAYKAAKPEDIAQLFAYCLILEDQGKRPPYGILQYSNATFEVPYTDEGREIVISIIEQMKAHRSPDAPCFPTSVNEKKCGRCSLRVQCMEA